MFAKRLIPHVFSVLLILVFTLALAGPVDVRQSSPAESSKAAEAPALLQYTSNGHLLGFDVGKVYLAGLDHALTVEFVGAQSARPIGPEQRADVIAMMLPTVDCQIG